MPAVVCIKYILVGETIVTQGEYIPSNHRNALQDEITIIHDHHI